MGCCGNQGKSNSNSSQSHANSDDEKKNSWLFWIIAIIILGLLVLSILR